MSVLFAFIVSVVQRYWAMSEVLQAVDVVDRFSRLTSLARKLTHRHFVVRLPVTFKQMKLVSQVLQIPSSVHELFGVSLRESFGWDAAIPGLNPPSLSFSFELTAR